MGSLYYDGHDEPVAVADDELAHLKAVIVAKLRRDERFALSWRGPRGRTTIWVAPAIDLRFEFDTAEPTELDADRLARLADEGTHGVITFAPAQR